MNDLDTTILDSIWGRVQWDYLFQNPQLSEWLEGSRLEATDEPDVFRLLVKDNAEWFSSHNLSIRRALSVELKRPVVVRVMAAEGVGR